MVKSWGVSILLKRKYHKVRDSELKWLIISKSVTIIIFVEFIDQLIDYPINCVSLNITATKIYKYTKILFQTYFLNANIFPDNKAATLSRRLWNWPAVQNI